MRLKNLLAVLGLLFVVALAPQRAAANDPTNYMYLSPDEIQLNEDGVGTVTVWVNTYITNYNSIMMDLYLPEGFTVEKNNRGKYKFTWNPDVVEDHSFTTGEHDGFIRMFAFSPSASYILPGDDWLFKFNIQAPEGYTGHGVLAFKNIEFYAGTTDTHKFDEIEAPIYSHDYDPTTGLDEVIGNVEDGTEVIYNLLGIRVTRPLAPGIYIVNGVKTLVK